ncbi:MAG: hypothetical protein H0V92_11205, partial [Pseudonocardiales bacterium]|nr:hypothetical protein [Pseudonocardiales bacterium]
QEAVLRLAARAVTAIGTQRRRGLGWVSIRPTSTDGEVAARPDLELLRAAEDH